MNKKKALIVFVVFVFVIALVQFLQYSKSNGQNEKPAESPATQEEKTSSVSIESDNEKISGSYEIGENETAFSMLEKLTGEKGIEIQTQKYDFGIFVKSIMGKESTQDLSWIYFVNGKSGDIAADKFIIKPGDIVEWKHIKPSVSE